MEFTEVVTCIERIQGYSGSVFKEGKGYEIVREDELSYYLQSEITDEYRIPKHRMHKYFDTSPVITVLKCFQEIGDHLEVGAEYRVIDVNINHVTIAVPALDDDEVITRRLTFSIDPDEEGKSYKTFFIAGEYAVS